MRITTTFQLACLSISSQVAAEWIIGLGSNSGDPICAQACARTLAETALVCSSTQQFGTLGRQDSVITSPDCYANDTYYLTTLAYCVQSKCGTSIKASKIDTWWESDVVCDPGTGTTTKPIQATPKWTYAESLNQIQDPPTKVIMPYGTLNYTALVDESTYQYQYDSQEGIDPLVQRQAQYGLALLVTFLVLPILLTWLNWIPGVHSIIERVKPFVVYRPLFGTRHIQLHKWLYGYIPTVGQSVYIFIVFASTIILMSIYETKPLDGTTTRYNNNLDLVTQRSGTFGYAILPVVVLFAGRNNVLLYLTNWSHTTYIMMHRWVSRLWFLLAIVHSICAWVWAVRTGIYSTEVVEKFWIWGIVATLTTVLLIVFSGTKIRQWSYNSFLVSHIVLAAITIVGCWYHIWLIPYGIGRYHNESQDWLYIAIAFWGFDRVVRLFRIVYNGMRRADVTELANDIVRIDIKGVRWDPEPGKHVYVHFPTLHPLRPWENHPFSWTPSALLQDFPKGPSQSDLEKAQGNGNIKEISDVSGEDGSNSSSGFATPTDQRSASTPIIANKTSAGITLFVRKSKGTTRLFKHGQNLLTLLDGPYHNNSYKAALRTDRLLLIGGGIGISGLVPWVGSHPNTKLAWSVQTPAESLVRSLSSVLEVIPEKDVRIGTRLDILELLKAEAAAGWRKVGVVVCGPGGLCDAARMAVIEAGKHQKTIFELDVDAYSW
ncbi:hypothetical protein M409DRAFT_16621 [Zasmidium cellare ATCC 36951]|uniref:FAD-binding FR-type domain-containing protein n=1 Tax=Zasmidium cellare ATCC 36951 TaxID=1080233 RepID=A0A6A6D3F6_ZASCE|nr:uncharacterized protein M409DRAFT_16621 [Zasmidium cellare ATCC 36951]KAF2172659.1 hypothetical protein M409DRAFT_16621 [Zasmidium cellare ATCC 36951]